MVYCAVCRAATATNLCDECASELDRPLPFVPEQVLSAAVQPQSAFVVDVWGRVHSLEKRTAVGRVPLARGLSILHASVSRRHAELIADDNGWQVVDLASTNGTMVNDHSVASARLTSGDRVCFGSLAFFFVQDDGLRTLDVGQIESRTLRPEDAASPALIPDAIRSQAETTHVGLPRLALRLIEAPAGGGGFLEAVGHRIQLSTTQYALLQMLHDRMTQQATTSSLVRGFVPSGQLIADLPWDATAPDENHLKQLIRRLRRALDAISLGGMIESRRGMGYRLRVVPIASDQSKV